MSDTTAPLLPHTASPWAAVLPALPDTLRRVLDCVMRGLALSAPSTGMFSTEWWMYVTASLAVLTMLGLPVLLSGKSLDWSSALSFTTWFGTLLAPQVAWTWTMGIKSLAAISEQACMASAQPLEAAQAARAAAQAEQAAHAARAARLASLFMVLFVVKTVVMCYLFQPWIAKIQQATPMHGTAVTCVYYALAAVLMMWHTAWFICLTITCDTIQQQMQTCVHDCKALEQELIQLLSPINEAELAMRTLHALTAQLPGDRLGDLAVVQQSTATAIEKQTIASEELQKLQQRSRVFRQEQARKSLAIMRVVERLSLEVGPLLVIVVLFPLTDMFAFTLAGVCSKYFHMIPPPDSRYIGGLLIDFVTIFHALWPLTRIESKARDMGCEIKRLSHSVAMVYDPELTSTLTPYTTLAEKTSQALFVSILGVDVTTGVMVSIVTTIMSLASVALTVLNSSVG